MKKIALLPFTLLFTFTFLAQETEPDSNYLNIVREGGGEHSAYDMGLGYVNGKPLTEGSAYLFENWDTQAQVFIKDKGRVTIDKVNINLFTDKFEALYDDSKVYTFDGKNIMKIAIADRVFRFMELDKDLRIFELIHNEKFSIYKYVSVLYAEASKDPMRNRSTNKFIKKEKYFLYKDGELTQLKTSKRAFAEMFKSDIHSKDDIFEYIKSSDLNLNDEAGLLSALKFASK